MDDGRSMVVDSKERQKALAAALAQIEKQFGKGSVMRLADGEVAEDIQVVSTGSLGLDIALGRRRTAARARGRGLRPRVVGQDDADAAGHRRDAEDRRHLRLHRCRARARHPVRAEAGRQPAGPAGVAARHRRAGARDRRRTGAFRFGRPDRDRLRRRADAQSRDRRRDGRFAARPAGATDVAGAAQTDRHRSSARTASSSSSTRSA